MKKSRLAWVAFASAFLIIGGCSMSEKPGSSGSADTSAMDGKKVWSGHPLNNPDSLLASRKVYFDFDSSEVRPEFVAMLKEHAAYLNSNLPASVTIEGHCDEKGSREYNIGLGERRASAIKNILQAEGVDSKKIKMISYGEERPQNTQNNVAAWAENRRGVLVY